MNDPDAGTTFLTTAVASFVRTTANTMLAVVTRLLVTTRLDAPAAKFTVPLGRLIVCAPVVPEAVLVAQYDICPSFLILYKVDGVEFCTCKALFAEVAPPPLTWQVADGVKFAADVPIKVRVSRIKKEGLTAPTAVPIDEDVMVNDALLLLNAQHEFVAILL